MLEAHGVTGIRRNREFWERAVREVEPGGSVSAFAQRFAVRPGTLSWWRGHLQKGPGTSAGMRRRRRSARAEFLPAVVAEPARPGGAGLVEIDAGGGRVRFEVGADVSYVAALVQALRSAC
jgi:transposase-like protein